MAIGTERAVIHPDGVRFYWRARSFDTYDGSQWTTTEQTPQTVPANEWPFRYPTFAARNQVIENFTTNVTTMRNIYTAGAPENVNRETDVLSQTFSDGTTDVLALLANPPLHGGETYQVRATVSNPTVLGLKETTNDYPDYIKQIYLQVPDTLPARVSDLAKQITAGLSNPYDQTMAITDWLRKNITYEIQIPPVPENRDILDWFLFDLKQGYCNYYATAEVIMLRTLGIPARLAVGYAEGESEQGGNTFTIRRKDSHAWPEVYFENYGWIEFEPTAAQPQRTLPSGELTSSSRSPDLPTNPLLNPDEIPTDIAPPFSGPVGPLPDQNSAEAAVVIITTFVVLLLVVLVIWMRRTNRLRFLTIPLPVLISSSLENRGISPPKWLRNWSNHIRLTPMEKLFSRINWMLILLGRRPQPSQTPAERVDTLVSAAPDARNDAYTFLAEYHKEEYSEKHGNYSLAKITSRRLWRGVALSMLRRVMGGQPS